MNITKVLAEETANKMVKPLEKKISLLQDEQVRIAEEVVRKSIPQEITDCFQKFRSYFSVAHNITLFNGSYEKRVTGLKGFPSVNTYYPHIEADREIIGKIDKLDIEISAVKNEKAKVYESVVASLLTLRTFKRIKENFPEAYRHIACYEDKERTSVALPINNIMDTLKKYTV